MFTSFPFDKHVRLPISEQVKNTPWSDQVHILTFSNPYLKNAFIDFLNSIPPRAPVCCFGPRKISRPIMNWCTEAGSIVAESGHLLVSGGARGCDQAFAAGADIVSAPKEIFWPQFEKFDHPVDALFDRSRKALEFTLDEEGGAIVVIPEEVFYRTRRRGGSFFSFDYARQIGLPIFLLVWIGQPFEADSSRVSFTAIKGKKPASFQPEFHLQGATNVPF